MQFSSWGPKNRPHKFKKVLYYWDIWSPQCRVHQDHTQRKLCFKYLPTDHVYIHRPWMKAFNFCGNLLIFHCACRFNVGADHSIFSKSFAKICTSGHYCLRESSSLWSDWVQYLKLRCAGAVWESRPSPPAEPSGNRTWSSPAFGPVPSSLCRSRRRNHTCLIPERRKNIMSVMERWEKKRELIFSRHLGELHITKINTTHLNKR